MAVKIRLARHGRHKLPHYRIVVADSENKRSGRKIEQIGTMNPLSDPPSVQLDEERVKYWLGVGAQPTDSAASIIERSLPGFLTDLEEKRHQKILSKRAARKARAKKAHDTKK